MRRALTLIFLSVALLAPSVSHAAPKKARCRPLAPGATSSPR